MPPGVRVTHQSTSARDLMAAADHLSGVRPGMSHDEIRAKLDATTPERQLALYLCDEMKKTRDSAVRAELRARMDVLVGKFPLLRSLMNQELVGRVSITRVRPAGRPRKHASDVIARREAQRAYRARQKEAPREAPK